MNFINFKHSIIFFNLCILISPLYQILNYEPIILCLFTILIIGISHGSLDNIKGKKLLKLFGYKSGILFYSIYLIISLSIIILWLILPNTVLLLFLIVAAFHFVSQACYKLLHIDSIQIVVQLYIYIHMAASHFKEY